MINKAAVLSASGGGGACCFVSFQTQSGIGCTVSSEINCLGPGRGGINWVAGASCQQAWGCNVGVFEDCTACATQAACCFGATCENMAPNDCTAQGGIPSEIGTPCWTDPCQVADPIKACCIGERCEDLTTSECLAQGGSSNVTGAKCADTTCIIPPVCTLSPDPGPPLWSDNLCDDATFRLSKTDGVHPSRVSGGRSRTPLRAKAWPAGSSACREHFAKLKINEHNRSHLAYCSKPRLGDDESIQIHRAKVGRAPLPSVPSEDVFADTNEGTLPGRSIFLGTVHTPFWFEAIVTSHKVRCATPR